jgi:hypothetical protein
MDMDKYTDHAGRRWLISARQASNTARTHDGQILVTFTDDLAWAEARAARDLSRIRQALHLWRDHSAAAPVAQPEPEGVAREEVLQWLRNDESWGVVIAPTEWRPDDDALLDLIRRAVVRFRRPAAAPVAQPEPETGEGLIELRKHFERILCDARSSGGPVVGNIALADHLLNAVSARYSRPPSAPIVPPELIRALELAEAALSDIRDIDTADADREPGNDVAWMERRAQEDLPRIRQALHLWRDHSAVAPVAVSERPWEREGFCDARGMCWVGEPKRDYPLGQTGDFDIWSAEWKLTDPTTLCGAARLIALLPHWAIPLPATPQEPQP